MKHLYQAKYKGGRRMIITNVKDIEYAYRRMVESFGNVEFIELKYVGEVN